MCVLIIIHVYLLYRTSPTSLVELLKQLALKLDGTTTIPVRRGYVLCDALRTVKRPSFISSKVVKVLHCIL